jgi:predicted NAD-dependent protein-ADP-ribosyltransferase YbiA (DUF1768 family)
LPSVQKEGVGELVVAVDCSGSISDRILALFQAEVQSLVAEHRPSCVHVGLHLTEYRAIRRNHSHGCRLKRGSCALLSGVPMPSIIQSFTGQYAFLSPLYRSAFYFENDEYLSTAAAFEAAKIINRRDRVSFVGWNIKPWDVKRVGKNIPKHWMRPDWDDDVEVDVMTEIQRAKFSWSDLRVKLLATVDVQLVHGNACHDNHWGICHCQSLPPGKRRHGVSPLCTGAGANRIGNIITQVRQECLDGLHCTPLLPECAAAGRFSVAA